MSTKSTEERRGERFGVHRVIEPKGVLPQPAWKLDNRSGDGDSIWDNEIVVDVRTLNVDAASFRQMEESAGSADGVGKIVLETIEKRGKQHNPITNSGGMLLGTVRHVGSLARDRGVVVGDSIATLASLSLTPLIVHEIKAIRAASAQLDVVGRAVIADGAPFAKMPTDLDERLALAVLDVAGAPIQVARRAQPSMRVLVLGGGGKSGILCAMEARRKVGPTGQVIAVESFEKYADELRCLGICDAVLSLDATNAMAVYDGVLAATGGKEVDLSICCVNVEAAEMATILPVRAGGCAYFFSMATAFGRAALGAEGVGKDVELVIGNGYAIDHAAYAIDVLRREHALRGVFERRYT
jgi:L-erythro-3,5-diaminohexanoate dehydrogenase